jgi:hypothetical protein
VDPEWDMPFAPYAQHGSFIVPRPTPSGPITVGTQYQLPCLPLEYILLLMGCLDQLRNPSTWADNTPATLDTTLAWITQLQEHIWSSVGTACVNPVVNVAIDCTNGLQYQTADGVWHVGTSMADICACTTACIVAPIPPNPQGATTSQHACNIAGFIAAEVIQRTMIKMESYVGTVDEQVMFARDVLQTIAFAFPITYDVGIFLYQFYQDAVGQTLAEVTAAATDPTLWADVTCAIYNAIRGVGYITAASYVAAGANLSVISSPHAWAVAAIAAFWNGMGLTNAQALQNQGAMDDVDCSGCGAGPLTAYFDFTTGAHGFSPYLGNPCTNVGGTGWEGGFWTAATPNSLSIDIVGTPTGWVLDSVELVVKDPASVTGTFPWQQRFCEALDAGGGSLGIAPFPNGAYPVYTTVSASFGGSVTPHSVVIYWPGDTNSAGVAPIIKSACFHNPLGFASGVPCPNPPFTY